MQIGEVTIGDPVNAFNTVAFDQQKLITHGDGRLHLSYDHPNSPFRYRVS